MSQIWKYPGNVSTVACENTLQKEFNIFEDFNPTGKTPYEFEFNDETLNVNSWISILEIICKYLYESNSDLFTAFNLNTKISITNLFLPQMLRFCEPLFS